MFCSRCTRSERGEEASESDGTSSIERGEEASESDGTSSIESKLVVDMLRHRIVRRGGRMEPLD